MAAKKQNTIPEDKLMLYEKLTATIRGIEIKGVSMPYTSVNGHMFSFLDKEGNLGLRLPLPVRTEFLSKFKTTLCEAHGTILKEYVLVPDAVFKNTGKLKSYFEISFQYVAGLKPKTTKK